jgi:hypothetical protein
VKSADTMSWFSGTSGAWCSNVEQSAFGPPPFSGLAMSLPSDATTATSTPLSGIFVAGLQDRSLVVADAQIGVTPALIRRLDEIPRS